MCSECKDTGEIQLLTSVVPCACRTASAPKLSKMVDDLSLEPSAFAKAMLQAQELMQKAGAFALKAPEQSEPHANGWQMYRPSRSANGMRKYTGSPVIVDDPTSQFEQLVGELRRVYAEGRIGNINISHDTDEVFGSWGMRNVVGTGGLTITIQVRPPKAIGDDPFVSEFWSESSWR